MGEGNAALDEFAQIFQTRTTLLVCDGNTFKIYNVFEHTSDKHVEPLAFVVRFDGTCVNAVIDAEVAVCLVRTNFVQLKNRQCLSVCLSSGCSGI